MTGNLSRDARSMTNQSPAFGAAISRRTLFFGGIASLAATGCSGDPASVPDAPTASTASAGRTTSSVGPAPSSSTGPPPSSSVATPKLGVRMYSLDELSSGQQIDDWVTGPKSVVLAMPDLTCVIASSALALPWSLSFTLDADETAYERYVAVEQDPDADPASAQVVLLSKAGAGLASAQFWVAVEVAMHRDEGVATGRYQLPATDSEPTLSAATMSTGTTVVTLTWSAADPDGDEDLAHRVAFSPTGDVLWQRTDRDNTNMGLFASGDEALPCLGAEDLVGGANLVVFGIDDQFVGVDAASGDELYRAKGPYSAGVVTVGPNAFAVEAYSEGGYGNGFSVFSKRDGQSVVLEASGIAFDPVADQLVASYAITDTGANEAPNNPETPSIQVLDASDQTVFTLERAEATALGNPTVTAAFDGRMIIAISDGIRIVQSVDGTPEPGFDSIPPGTFRLSNVPIVTGLFAVVLGNTNGYGETGRDFARNVVVSDEPLTWLDLDVSLTE